jgi:hypothetical protein
MTTQPNTMTAFKLDKLPKVSTLTKSDDFFVWKSEILDAAEFAYFKDILTDNDDDCLGLDYSKFGNRRRKIAGFLFLRNSVDRQYHDLINGAETPTGAWKNFVSKFDRKTTGNIQTLFRQLTNLQCERKADLAEHVTKFNKLWVNLGQKLPTRKSDEEKNTIKVLFSPVLHSQVRKRFYFVPILPRELDNMVETLTVRDDITFEELVEKLLENVRDDKIKDGDLNEEKGYTAQSKKQYNQNMRCYNCDGIGYISRFCKMPKKEQARINQSSETGTEEGFMATRHSSHDGWILDCGVSAHMTDQAEMTAAFQWAVTLTRFVTRFNTRTAPLNFP